MLEKIKNFNSDSQEKIDYKGTTIVAYRNTWEQYDESKDKWNSKKSIQCTLFRHWKKYKILNLGGCSDGAMFTAVSQAINEAKWLVDYDIEKAIDNDLLKLGLKREDLFKYNKLKIWDRISTKQKLKQEIIEILKT